MVVDESEFGRDDCTLSEFGHITGNEELTPNISEPRGQVFVVLKKLDSDHVSDNITQRSIIRFLICVNYTPTHWTSKK